MTAAKEAEQILALERALTIIREATEAVPLVVALMRQRDRAVAYLNSEEVRTAIANHTQSQLEVVAMMARWATTQELPMQLKDCFGTVHQLPPHPRQNLPQTWVAGYLAAIGEWRKILEAPDPVRESLEEVDARLRALWHVPTTSHRPEPEPAEVEAVMILRAAGYFPSKISKLLIEPVRKLYQWKVAAKYRKAVIDLTADRVKKLLQRRSAITLN